MKKALVILAPGFEEIEAIAPIDLLRRAGVTVTTLSIAEDLLVLGGHGIPVQADALAKDCRELGDLVVVPGGGGGSKAIAASQLAAELIMAHVQAGRLVAAICAAPAVVLYPLGLLTGKHFTCFPGMEDTVKTGWFSPERVVQDGQIITSRGAGTALEFGLHLVRLLAGEAKAEELQKAILHR